MFYSGKRGENYKYETRTGPYKTYFVCTQKQSRRTHRTRIGLFFRKRNGRGRHRAGVESSVRDGPDAARRIYRDDRPLSGGMPCTHVLATSRRPCVVVVVVADSSRVVFAVVDVRGPREINLAREKINSPPLPPPTATYPYRPRARRRRRRRYLCVSGDSHK